MNKHQRRMRRELHRLQESTKHLSKITWTPKTEVAINGLTNGIEKRGDYYFVSDILKNLRSCLIISGLIPDTYREWKDGCFSIWSPGQAFSFSLLKEDVANLREFAKQQGLTVQKLLEHSMGSS